MNTDYELFMCHLCSAQKSWSGINLRRQNQYRWNEHKVQCLKNVSVEGFTISLSDKNNGKTSLLYEKNTLQCYAKTVIYKQRVLNTLGRPDSVIWNNVHAKWKWTYSDKNCTKFTKRNNSVIGTPYSYWHYMHSNRPDKVQHQSYFYLPTLKGKVLTKS